MIVIADANPWVRRELGLYMSAQLGGESIVEARSPSAVLDAIADPKRRILVIDPRMPTRGQCDGIPLLRQICRLRPELFVVVLSEEPHRLLRQRNLPPGIAHAYRKQMSPAWLWHIVTPALRAAEAAQENAASG